MADILSIFTAPELMGYTRTIEQKPLLGELFFPETKIENLEFSYIKGSNNLPVAAGIHAFDTEAEIGAREGFEKITQDLAMIKRKIRMNEKEILVINTSNSNAAVEAAKKVIFNDALRMFNSVKTRVEAMRMEVLSSGICTLSNEEGLNIPVDYGVPSENKKALTGTALWSDPAATPIDDIYDWINDIVNRTGFTPKRALTSNRIVQFLLKNEGIRKAMFGVNYTMQPTTESFNSWLATQGFPRIATYDERYITLNKAGAATAHRYLPEDKFILMPEVALGETVYGVTPEELELRNAGVEMTESDNVVITTYKTVDPVATWTKATALAMPSFPEAGNVIQAKVI